MRISTRPNLDQTRGIHRSTNTRVEVEQESTLKLRFKIYQVLLVLIALSMVYYWHKSLTLPKKGLTEFETNIEEDTGFFNHLVKKMAKQATLYFVVFITEPLNLSLIMMCLFSRIVLNFVAFNLTIAYREFVWGYEIDESYFVPLIPSSPVVDV
ncbi:hypothetical protein GCK72_024240 [Caenorhabditis remanei]|uniref:Uncharacterized protein n=1 Tax=Caenorhabditis remanei TaxID=31234 RepID=A0A6A5FZA6_CAERE|nr:hypothetical protein GCK72_024240 [Caenorhabditis remanei]KAF1747774.1 hypothetical protein GCK72_024240 [Caenorhabditis remanei]